MTSSFLTRLILVSAVSVLNCNCFCSADTPASPPSPTLAEANQFLIVGDYRKAEGTYRPLIAFDHDGAAYAGLILSLAKQHRISEAEKYIREARERFPGNTELKAAAAFASYDRAIHSTDACKRDLYLSAAEHLSLSAIKENPDNVTANQTLGLAKLAMSEPEQAVESLRKCAELMKTPENLINLVLVLRNADPTEQERGQLINEALSLDPLYFPARVEQAALLVDQNKPQDAFVVLQKIPQTHHDARWSLVAGDIFSKNGNNNAAFTSWNNAVQLDPFLSDSYLHMADYYASHEKYELAVSVLQRGLDVNPFDTALRTQFSKITSKPKKT